MRRTSKATGRNRSTWVDEAPDADETEARGAQAAEHEEPPLVEDLDADDDIDELDERSSASEAEETGDGGSQGADDALGLYLRQMGAIPLLNRAQELALAKQLEAARRRFRHAALSSGVILRRVLDTFERIHNGQLTLDPMIDVVTSLGLSRDRILARLPFNLRSLKQVVKKLSAAFPDAL